MIGREQIIDALNDVFTRMVYSMAEYVLEAKPYLRPGQEGWLIEIGKIAASDKAMTDHVARAIQQMEGIPQLGTYDPEVANLNYLSMDFLIKALIDELEKNLAMAQRGVELSREAPPALEVFELLRNATQDHLKSLRALQTANLSPAA
jgi:bacterioferritin (cytochrome b1)